MLLLLIITSIPSFVDAQTTVNLTVQDTASVTWNGPWTVVLRPPPGFPPSTIMAITQGGGSTSSQSGTLSNGTATIVLPGNGNMVPQGSLWYFTVCFSSTGNCFNQLVNVSTTSPQNLTITPPAPGAPSSGGSGGITSVSSLPGTCTVGQGFILPSGAVFTCGPLPNQFVASGVTGGTFGASPSSGYTFTSTPIATNPFNGNLLIGANVNGNATGSYTAGAGYSLIGTGTIVLGFEYQLAAAATSYSSPFTYSVNSGNWGGIIAAFAPSGTPTLVQGKTGASISSLAFTSNNGAGNLLVAVFRYNGASAAPMASISDTQGNTWVSAGARCFEGYSKGANDANFLEVWYALNSIAGPNTVTPTMGSGTTGGATHIGIAEFSGVATSNALVDYNFTGSTTGATSIPGATTNSQFTINAVNNSTGVIDFTGRDSAAVFRSAANARASTGGMFYFKNGTYPGQTSLHESVAGQTNWYVWGVPSPVGSQEVSWHIVCESFTQILYATLQTDGCIHQILPSAYAGPQPASNTLSGFWQRPSVTFGSTNNNTLFFVNNTVRIPDNQHTPSNSYDTFTAVYSSHVGTNADTVIIAADQLCGGLSLAATGVNGYRTNQSATDETYFDNTWAIGFNSPYNILSNHFKGFNMHAACNVNATTVNISAALYGGLLEHFGDYHNLTGFQLNCQQVGTRIDMVNMIQEFAITGTFARAANASEVSPGNCVGNVTVTTASANNVTFVSIPFFAAGSGANFRVSESIRLVQPGILNANFTSSATTGTSKQTLATYTFIYNALSGAGTTGPFQNNSGAVFRIKAWGTTLNNIDAKVFEIDFGGTAIATITATPSIAGSVKCEAEIIVSSVANTQEIVGYCDDGTTRTVTRTAPAITGNANIILNIAATTAIAAGDFTFKGLTIEYLGGQ